MTFRSQENIVESLGLRMVLVSMPCNLYVLFHKHVSKGIANRVVLIHNAKCDRREFGIMSRQLIELETILKFVSPKPRTRVIFPRTAFASSSSAMARGKSVLTVKKHLGPRAPLKGGLEEKYFLMPFNFVRPVQPKTWADANVCL